MGACSCSVIALRASVDSDAKLSLACVVVSAMLKIAWNSHYCHPLPAGHRFPMEKYNLVPEQLLYEGTVSEINFFSPEAIELRWLSNVHEHEYLSRLEHGLLTKKEIRESGFPFSDTLVHREKVIMEGTRQVCEYALQFGIAANMAGGTHHAFSYRPEGFCLLNDIAIGAQWLLDQKLVERVLVVDLDVHQGNGTAQIFKNNSAVFTFSMHGAKNFPHRKETSDLDVALPDGTTDQHYLDALGKNLENILDAYNPQFIFYQCGVDVLATDALGRLALTNQGCKERDRKVFQMARSNNIPLVFCMGGGYSPQIKHVVDAHANTYRLAQEIYF